MADRLEPDIVHDILHAEKPGTVQQLVNSIRERTNATSREIVSLLRVMVSSGVLKIKKYKHDSKQLETQLPQSLEKLSLLNDKINAVASNMRHWYNRWIFLFIYYLSTQLLPNRKEMIVKAMFFILVFNAISWIILLWFQSSMILAPFRIIFHAINLLFVPGFSMTLTWYPFKSERLDFSKLNRKSNFNDGRRIPDVNSMRQLDFLTRVAYSICYSIGLVILAGFLIGLLGFGFNITIMLGIFTIIEVVVILDVSVKISQIRDPYLHI